MHQFVGCYSTYFLLYSCAVSEIGLVCWAITLVIDNLVVIHNPRSFVLISVHVGALSIIRSLNDAKRSVSCVLPDYVWMSCHETGQEQTVRRLSWFGLQNCLY